MVTDTNNMILLSRSLDAIMTRVAAKTGAYLEDRVDQLIHTGDPAWAPKSPNTLMKYAREKPPYGHKTEPWQKTTELLNLITHRIVSGDTAPYQIEVGIFDHPKADIAAVLEYGTRDGRIPARPLFSTVFDLEAENIPAMITRELEKELNKFLL